MRYLSALGFVSWLTLLACSQEAESPAPSSPPGGGAGQGGTAPVGGGGAGGGQAGGGTAGGGGSGGEAVVFADSCLPDPVDPSAGYVYQVPKRIDDGLPVGDIRESGISLDMLTQPNPMTGEDGILVQLKRGDVPEFHSMLIVKGGKLVLEEYYTGNDNYFDANRTWIVGGPIQHDCTHLHYTASITKSITALLTGMVFGDAGLTPAEMIAPHLPGYADLLVGDKATVTAANLMTMQTGFQWEEWVAQPNDLTAMLASPDYLSFLFQKPLLANRLEYHYNNAAPNVMMGVLDNILDDPACTPNCVKQFAKERFFDKLKITDYTWFEQPNGEARHPNPLLQGSIGLSLTSRSLAKIGMMMNQDGMFDGQQIVPKAFLDDLKMVHASPANDLRGYGYWWWIRDSVLIYPDKQAFHTYYSAEGDGGTYIEAIPTLDMVVIFTGGNYLDFKLYENATLRVLRDFVVPAALAAPAP